MICYYENVKNSSYIKDSPFLFEPRDIGAPHRQYSPASIGHKVLAQV